MTAWIVLAACSGKNDSSPADSCPRDGVVLAQARDVEREAEGIATTAFGPPPDHVPDFATAGGILSLLVEVWDGTKSACPDLTPSVVTGIDDAIARLSIAIPAGQQADAAYAGNDVHIATAPLFDYFGRDKPVQLEEMDALFLRVGLDAWFGDWGSFESNLATIHDDWKIVSPVVDELTPVCHRVAGTQSVSGDVGKTIASLLGAGSSKDVDAAEIVSDDGLAEIDILEQLYDCPPDDQSPDSGLGSACTGDADCGGGDLVCDLENAGSRCAPDPTTTNIGAPCTTTVDCGTYERDACNNEIGDGYPGGYCTLEPCDDVQVCSPGSTCVSMPFETPACMATCTADTDCRTSEGYVCQLFPTTPPIGFGPSDHACAFPCVDNAGCTTPLVCDVATGRCTP
jgi:hypothetical protein